MALIEAPVMTPFATWLAMVTPAVTYLITTPVLLYNSYQLWKHWNEAYIVKKYRLILVIFLFTAAYESNEIAHYSGCKIMWKTTFCNDTVSYCRLAIGFTNRFVVYSLLALRVYMLHYDHQFERVLSQEKWQIMIHPKIHENWYLQNRRKWGDPLEILMRILIPIYIVWILMVIILTITGYWMVYAVLTSLSPLGCFMICGYYWRSFPVFEDVLYIREEIRIFILTTIVVFVIYLGGAIIYAVDYEHKVTYVMTNVLVMEFVLCFQMSLMILYPQYKLRRDPNERRLSEMMAGSESPSTSEDPKYRSWQGIIQTDDGYEQFAKFLEHEFSTENIMFITEYLGVKNRMKQNETLNTIITEKDISYNLKLPSAAPQCRTLHANLSELNLSNFSSKPKSEEDIALETKTNQDIALQSLKRIYYRYIDPSKAVLQVNISYRTRRQLQAVFHVEDGEEIPFDRAMALLETAIVEISKLMNDSYHRFRETRVFKKLSHYQTSPRTSRKKSNPL